MKQPKYWGIVILCFVSMAFLSCSIISSNNTYCIIENRTNTVLSIVHIDGFVQNDTLIEIGINEKVNIKSTSRSIGEVIEIVVEIDKEKYLVSSGYIQDYSYFKIVFKENNRYELYSPNNKLLNNGSLLVIAK
jgi:hypothetical protein